MNNRTLVGAALVLPCVIVTLIGLWAMATNHSGGWIWPPDTVTISEAVVVGDYAEVARQIESGVDPNRPVEVRPDFLGDAATRVTPLQAAVWARSPLMVKQLLDRGVIVGETSLTVLKCLNDQHNQPEVRELLDALPIETSLSCDEVSLPE